MDDDSVDRLLVRLLRRAGHDVCLPIDVGLVGAYNATPLAKAVVENRVLLTHNHGDFDKLHTLVITVSGHHPGVLTVRRDNNPERDLAVQGIVRAIARLLASRAPIPDQMYVLNHWR